MTDDTPPTCANCGTELTGRFCHDCGQEDRNLDTPFRELLVDWLGNAFAYLFLALRRVYGDSRRRTAAKMAVLLLAHLVAITITLLATFLLTLALDAGGSG